MSVFEDYPWYFSPYN